MNNMKTLNQNTKAAKNLITKYVLSKITDLRECYQTFSINKQIALIKCKDKMREEKGVCFKIISHSRFFFSCAWITENGLRVETPSESYLIKDWMPF